MDKNELIKLIDDGMTTYAIAKHMNTSQTNVRYWLRKYGLNTHHVGEKQGVRNGKKCLCCEKELEGNQKKFCSKQCKQKYHHFNGTKENPNTSNRQIDIARKRKMILIEMKGGECQSCGYKRNMAGLTFHHRNPENKTFNLDGRRLSNTKFDSILLEAEKCDLLCHNCHMELHYPEMMML